MQLHKNEKKTEAQFRFSLKKPYFYSQFESRKSENYDQLLRSSIRKSGCVC